METNAMDSETCFLFRGNGKRLFQKLESAANHCQLLVVEFLKNNKPQFGESNVGIVDEHETDHTDGCCLETAAWGFFQHDVHLILKRHGVG